MISLTQQQRKLFNYIKHCISTTGVAPSQREMALHLDMKSTGPLNAMLHEIEARGWIIVHKYKSRAIEILDAKCPHCGGAL